MSNDEIDLERGDPARAEATEKKAATRSRATKSGSAPKPVAAETSLKARLENVFEKLAKQMEARGDEELATALSEEKSNMSQGLVSLTKNLTPLRGPLVVVRHSRSPGGSTKGTKDRGIRSGTAGRLWWWR
jgi:hypothetical protein